MRANSTLAKAVRFALIGGATTAALSSMAVYAEEGDNAKVERIEVTGSRIQRTDMESALPVTVLSAEDIAIQSMMVAGEMCIYTNLNISVEVV